MGNIFLLCCTVLKKVAALTFARLLPKMFPYPFDGGVVKQTVLPKVQKVLINMK